MKHEKGTDGRAQKHGDGRDRSTPGARNAAIATSDAGIEKSSAPATANPRNTTFPVMLATNTWASALHRPAATMGCARSLLRWLCWRPRALGSAPLCAWADRWTKGIRV